MIHKSMSRWFSHFFLIGILLCAGVAQAQSYNDGTNSKSIETKAADNYLQPRQPCLNSDQDAIKGSLQEERHQSSKTVNVPGINKSNSKDKTKKADGAENTCYKSDSSGPSFGKNGGSITQNMGPRAGGVGGLPTSQGSMTGGLGSSFLDGYLLRSLQAKEIGRKKETKEKESKDDLPQKVKKTF